MMILKPKLLYFITEDWFFCSHFLDRAIAAHKAGFEVMVVTRVRDHGDSIAREGIRVIPFPMARSGMNPWHEFKTLVELARIYRRERPHIVHHIAVKPILYGTIAAKIAGIAAIVNAPVGMGYIFSSSQLKARLLRPLLLTAYRWLMNPRNSIVVFENPDDQAQSIASGIANELRARLIRGAGVDVEKFAPSAEAEGPPVIVLASRMIWNKGVGEFVEAARLLRSQRINARFVLAGAPDMENPATVSQTQLEAWRAEGIVEWWGYQRDMPAVLRQTHVFCLPTSYAEGLPKALIEAAAAGKPIVTTDAPGCREIVHDGVNGMLVPAKQVGPLAEALKLLIESPQLRARMGAHGRKMAVEGFSTDRVNAETLYLYQELLRSPSLGNAPNPACEHPKA